MRKVSIKNTDLMVSQICYGAAFCDLSMQAEYEECLDYFCESGGNFLDSANIYGKWLDHGKNSHEMMIGKWLKKKGNRNSMVIASKAAHPHLATMEVHRMSHREITADLDESLSALQTDYVDILYLHRDAESVPVGEIVDILLRIQETGKIRHFACSNWKPERIEEALSYSAGKKAAGFVINQLRWSLAVPNALDGDDKTCVGMDGSGMDLHRRTGLAAAAYNSQASGFFTKYDNGEVSEGLGRRFINETNKAIYANMKRLSEKTGHNCTAISLAYLMSQGITAIPVIASRTMGQLSDSLAAANVRLGPEEAAALTEAGG